MKSADTIAYPHRLPVGSSTSEDRVRPFLDAPSYRHLAYNVGMNQLRAVVKNGAIAFQREPNRPLDPA